MHRPIPEQKWLGQLLRGHFGYFAVPTNIRALTALRYRVVDVWRRSLQRRSQKDGATWARVAELAHLPQFELAERFFDAFVQAV
jgi:hypothetical protein